MDIVIPSQLPTLVHLYARKHLTPLEDVPLTPSHTLNSRICLVRYDITKLKVDAIVNAANESLMGGGGVDGAIHNAAGPRLLDECETLNGCGTGGAKITDGYRLPAKKVIHAVGPIYHLENRRETGRAEKLLRSCYRTSLDLCDEHGLQTIAFSCLSTGIYGYPSDAAAAAALSEVRNYFDEGNGQKIERVVFCTFMPKDQAAYTKLIPKYFPHATIEIPSTAEASLSSNAPEGDDEEHPITETKVETLISPGSAEPDAKKQKLAEESASDSPNEIPTKSDPIAIPGAAKAPATHAIPETTAPPKEAPPKEKEEEKIDDAAQEDITDDEWVQIDKSSIPHKATVEDADDE